MLNGRSDSALKSSYSEVGYQLEAAREPEVKFSRQLQLAPCKDRLVRVA